MALGLEADRPTVLVMGGSQGARAINRLMLGALGHWPVENVEPQFVHLTGEDDHAEVQTGYARRGFPARVAPFLEEMDLALGAADIAVTRAGASTLAELAAVQLPAILIPFPAAADNHQFHNARAYVDTGAAWLCEQGTTTEAALAAKVRSLLREPRQREAMAAALARWHRPAAAADMAGVILRAVESGRRAGAGLCRGRRNPKVTAASGMERRGQRGQGTSLVVRAGL